MKKIKKKCIKCKRKKLEHNFDIVEIKLSGRPVRSDTCKKCEKEQSELCDKE